MVLVAQNEILSINKSASALKSLRLIFDYEQDEMARILGVKLDYYKDLENSTVAPNNFIIEKLKDKFKMIDSRYFIDWLESFKSYIISLESYRGRIKLNCRMAVERPAF